MVNKKGENKVAESNGIKKRKESIVEEKGGGN